MVKNTGSQVVCCQMVSATDGSAFTGSVTCYVTGNAGTQAAGSVSSGACTHEGQGVHSYAPAQAETNYDNVCFTFTGTGAVPATVQVYPVSAVGGTLTAAERTAVGDALLVRDLDAVEGAAPVHSLTGAALKLVSKVDDDGAGSLKTYKTNGTDVFSEQAITTGASLEPIDALGIATAP